MADIKVHVLKRKGRAALSMRYLDPDTNRHIERSTGTTKQREAEKLAAQWEAELREGRYQPRNRMSWQEFRDHHDENILQGMSKNTAGAYESSLNVFVKYVNPQRMSDLTTARMTSFATKLRDEGRSPATISHHLKNLLTIFRWAKAQGFLREVPAINPPKKAKGMKGRAISGEEFDRMIDAVEKIVGEANSEAWKFYLWGLWHSGLRLEESLNLRWDEAPGAIVVDLTGRRPLLRIPAEAEKGKTHRLLPITPEFAAHLATVRESDRRGRVFRLTYGESAKPVNSTRHAVGKYVGAIGKAAGVVTTISEKGGEVVKRFATAHDLRRSFGFRWSRLVMPTILRELMRHESLETTTKFYIGHNAEATADELWAAIGGNLGGAPSEAATTVSENA